MAERFDDINTFIEQVRARMNRHLGLHLLIAGLGAAGAVLLLIGLAYVLRGYRVPLFWYPVVLILTGMAAFGLWLGTRRSPEEAAMHADRHFQLKDAVCSYHGFSQARKQGGIFDLQAQQTRSVVAGVSASELKVPWPVRTTLVCVPLLVGSLLLTLKADSPGIVQTREKAEQVAAQTGQLNQRLQEILEEIEEQADREGFETLIEPDALQTMVEELRTTTELKDALRQYTQVENRLNQILAQLQQRKDEQMYTKMGEALKQQEPGRELGERLTERQYREAAEELRKLKIDRNASAQTQRAQLEKARAIAERMAREAQQDNGSSQAARLAQRLDKAADAQSKTMNAPGRDTANQKSGNPQNPASQHSGSPGSGSQSTGTQGTSTSGSGSPGSDTGSADSGSEGSSDINNALGDMSDHLSDLDAKCKAQLALKKLCDCLSQGQAQMGNGLDSEQNSAGNGAGDGGLEPGTGSADTKNNQINQASGTGDKSVLKGIKNRGPSVTSTEAAADGSGSRRGVNTRLIQQYQHQVEAFVRREDVSEAVKSGVKAYFENIHSTNIEEGN